MVNKHDLIIQVCELEDNAPDYYEGMPSDEFNYFHGYIKALLDVTDVINKFDN